MKPDSHLPEAAPPSPPRLASADRERLDQLRERLAKGVKAFAGYPVNADFDFRELWDLLAVPLNNVGDPWSPSLYGLNTHDFDARW